MIEDLRPGLTVYVQGASGESHTLQTALSRDPQRAQGVDFVGGFVPGLNRFDYAALDPAARMTTFMMLPELAGSYAARRVRRMPMAYSQIAQWFASEAEIDVAYLHLTPPDEAGRCSFGVAPDFGPLVLRRARRRIGLINARMPRPARGPTVALADLDCVFEIDETPITEPRSESGGSSLDVACHVASLIPDGAALQTGIGSVPEAVLSLLRDRRGLRVQSGILTNGYRALSEAGALAAPDQHRCGIAYGPVDFYDFLRDADIAEFASADLTHGAAELIAIERLFAVNSALEVDLYGQVNAEWRGAMAISGVGGGPDFARAASRCVGGLSIVALAASAGRGAISRIVPRLTCPTVSIGRQDVDVVVTEFGAARLRGIGEYARAEALIAIAAPQHRAQLAEAWRDQRAE